MHTSTHTELVWYVAYLGYTASAPVLWEMVPIPRQFWMKLDQSLRTIPMLRPKLVIRKDWVQVKSILHIQSLAVLDLSQRSQSLLNPRICYSTSPKCKLNPRVYETLTNIKYGRLDSAWTSRVPYFIFHKLCHCRHVWPVELLNYTLTLETLIVSCEVSWRRWADSVRVHQPENPVSKTRSENLFTSPQPIFHWIVFHSNVRKNLVIPIRPHRNTASSQQGWTDFLNGLLERSCNLVWS